MPHIEISINRLWPGEKLPQSDPRWGRYTRSFHRERHTIDSLVVQIRKGYAFSPVMKGGYRKQENFSSAQHIGLDDDRGIPDSSIDALAQNPFIADHAAFLYETPSSTPERPKSRIVFILDQPITDRGHYRLGCRALAWKFGDTDQSVAEESRFFYGVPNSRVVKLGNILCQVSFQAEVVDPFLDHLRERATNRGKDIPGIPSSLAVGTSSAERYINRAVEEEVAWLSSRREGTGERHRGLLISALKLASLRLSEWLPPAARQTIDPYSILLPAARANGYIAKYGEDVARRTIADGISYATPRSEPEGWDHSHRPSRGNSRQLLQRLRCRKNHGILPTIEVPL